MSKKETAKEVESAEGLVKVRILGFVGKWIPGEEIEVSEAQAEELCRETSYNDGHGIQKRRKAMYLNEAISFDHREIDLSKISQHELTMLGRKNIVETPKDPELEAKFEKFSQVNEPENDEVANKDSDMEPELEEKPKKKAK
jgi:hypothetical protein